MVFQNYNLFKNKTVLENVMLPMTNVRKIPKSEAREKAIHLIQKVGLEEKIHSYPSRLSGGQQQRIGIAAAMLLQPSVLLADEPTSALDVTIQKQVVEEMALVRKTFGTAIVLVSHNLGVIGALADNVLVLKDGKCVEYGRCAQVLSNPGSAYAKALLSAVPRLRR